VRAVLLFTGEPDRLLLVTRSDRRLEGGGLVLAEFRAEARDGTTALVTIRRPVSGTAGGGAPPEPKLLLDGINGLAFRFFGRSAPDAPPGWTNAWKNPNALPRLIEISIAADGRSGFAWPALVAPLPAHGEL
jgi:hypothetical protein